MDDALLRRAQELLAALIAFDTVSDRSNLACIDFIEDTLKLAGARTWRAPNAAGDKAALLAMFGPPVEGGVVLSGHTDVVPVVGQAWSGDPFALRRVGDRLVGRGACDMKGFLAGALAAAERFGGAGLKRPILQAFSYDEETTCLGSLDLIALFGAALPRPALAIVGEPTGLEVADSHKGVATFLTRVEGRAAHSSKPSLGADAVGVACDIGAEIARLGRAREAGAGDPRFDPPHSTFHVGIVRGGEAVNVLAAECLLRWEFRALPGETAADANAEVRRFIDTVARPRLGRWIGDVDIVTTMEIDVPALKPTEGGPGRALALGLARRNATVAASFASEAGHFQRAGIETFLCGPGSIAQAHQPDEFVTIDQMAGLLAFLGRLWETMAL